MVRPISMDKERVHFNIARVRKGGEIFEIVVDPDAAIAFKNKAAVDLKDVLKSEHIFSDAKKGQLASEEHMKVLFGTKDTIAVSKKILAEGELQLTKDYRHHLHESKKSKIIDIIQRNSVDPKTGLPHPRTRIENALEEAKVKIDFYKAAEDQVQEVLKQIRTVLPIKFETIQIEVKIGSKYAAKMYGLVSSYSKILRDSWLTDGTWMVVVEIPAGVQNEFYDRLNSSTHGEVSTRIIKI